MRIRILCLAITVVGCFSAVGIGHRTVSTIPEVLATHPVYRTVCEEVHTTGVLQQSYAREVYLEVPVIAREVHVSVGDVVKKGEALVSVDLQLTKQALANSVRVQKETSQLPALETYAGVSSLLEQFGYTEPEIQELTQTQEITVPQTILAPMDGVITAMNIQSGVLTQTGVPLVSVGDTRYFQMVAEVTEEQIAEVAIGDTAIVSGSGFPHKSYEGIVTKIYPAAQSGTQKETEGKTVVLVCIDILDPDGALKDGFSASAAIRTEPEENVMTLPYQAIRQDVLGQEYVFLFENGRAVRRDIKVVREFAWDAQVSGDIREEDLILLPEGTLTDGSRIRARKGGSAVAS